MNAERQDYLRYAYRGVVFDPTADLATSRVRRQGAGVGVSNQSGRLGLRREQIATLSAQLQQTKLERELDPARAGVLAVRISRLRAQLLRLSNGQHQDRQKMKKKGGGNI